MATKKRDLLQVLKLELEFLKSGGYRKSPSWRPRFMFEDSPTCLNYGNPENKRACSECVLMQLVPAGDRNEKIPCRHIPLNQQNQTIESLYRCGSVQELETAVSEWLMEMIQELETKTRKGSLSQAV